MRFHVTEIHSSFAVKKCVTPSEAFSNVFFERALTEH
jgi:hypothetical protein